MTSLFPGQTSREPFWEEILSFADIEPSASIYRVLGRSHVILTPRSNTTAAHRSAGTVKNDPSELVLFGIFSLIG